MPALIISSTKRRLLAMTVLIQNKSEKHDSQNCLQCLFFIDFFFFFEGGGGGEGHGKLLV